MIVSHEFGGVELTGEDAATFVRQVKFGRPKASARASLARGRDLLEEMQKTGVIKFSRTDHLQEPRPHRVMVLR